MSLTPPSAVAAQSARVAVPAMSSQEPSGPPLLPPLAYQPPAAVWPHDGAGGAYVTKFTDTIFVQNGNAESFQNFDAANQSDLGARNFGMPRHGKGGIQGPRYRLLLGHLIALPQEGARHVPPFRSCHLHRMAWTLACLAAGVRQSTPNALEWRVKLLEHPQILSGNPCPCHRLHRD